MSAGTQRAHVHTTEALEGMRDNAKEAKVYSVD